MTHISRRRVLVSGPAFAVAARYSWGRPKAFTPTRVVLGTGEGSDSKGIYTASWNPSTGVLGPVQLAAELPAPTFLATHPHGRESFIYAISEVAGDASRVTAFTTSAGQETLRKLNDMPAGGDGPAHVAVSADGRAVFCANYAGGSISSFKVKDDGSLSECVSHFQYSGSGPYAGRQEKPHTHSVNPSPDNKWLLVNDLGVDKIFIYHMDTRTAQLTAADPAFWQAKPGSGPRHLAFHPNGRWAYSVNELTSTVDILDWNSHKGTLTLKASVSTLKPGYPPNTAFAGEILCSQDGRQVYVGNRVGDDTISVFQVDAHTGLLTLSQNAQNPGKNPRHVALDPSGRWVVLCDVSSSIIAVLARDPQTGQLTDTGRQYPLGAVEFLAFI